MIRDTKIFIDRLRVHAPVGVDAQERQIGNDFEVSVTLTYPMAEQAGITDMIYMTVNYADVVDEIRAVMSEEVQLVETAATSIIIALINRWKEIEEVIVTVAKLAPPVKGAQCASMGVTFRWSK